MAPAVLLELGQLRTADFHDLSVVRMLEHGRLRAPAQLFQSLPHLTPGRFAGIAMLTVWIVDSQHGQEAADLTSQVHDPPRRTRVIRLGGCCVPMVGAALRGGGT